ncbi:MAG: TIGR03118 family protein [Candidatus Sulfotelmatobacter sp.]
MSRLPTRVLARAFFAGLMLVLFSSMATAQYKLTNLVSNQKGVAVHTDPLLVNAWGLAYGPGGPFWISDNGSGWSTLYTAAGVEEGLKVLIPTAGGDGPGSATGIVFNGSSDFNVQGWPAIFLFATLDGTISGWAPQSNANDAIVAVTTPGAVYTGLAISSNTSGNFLFAADNANNKVDVFDSTFKLVNSFTDTTLPAGFAPFGIQDFGGLLYVSFASPSGASGGYIDIYSEGGILLKRLAQGGLLNQPWGFAIAPKNFGPLSNTLLVSNNTNSGTINAFNSVTGQFVGTIRNTTGKDIVINQLWGIEFGGGSPKDGFTNELFFTAGPDNNLAGTFGKIVFE